MMSRLMLNLRVENERVTQGGLTAASISRPVFAPRILGDFTAELRGDGGTYNGAVFD